MLDYPGPPHAPRPSIGSPPPPKGPKRLGGWLVSGLSLNIPHGGSRGPKSL